MKILICSDGSEQAENALRFGALIAAGARASVTLLGVVEKSGDETPLMDALRRGMQFAKDKDVTIELLTKNGDPVPEIQKHTSENSYDLVLIGAAYKGHSGPFVMSVKAYKLIKVIASPVLVVTSKRSHLQRVLVCSGGGRYIDKAIELVCKIAKPLSATVSLLHVLPDTPAMYDAIMSESDSLERLLASNSVLGHNLRHEKEILEKAGVKSEMLVRHGEVSSRILEEIQTGNYDLIVTGSRPAGGAIHTYMMGNVTSDIVNHSLSPVLVVRAEGTGIGGFWALLRKLWK